MSQEVTRRGASVAPPSRLGALPLLSVLFLLFFAGAIGAGYMYQDYAKNKTTEGVSDADVKAALARVDARPIRLKVVPKLPSYEFPPIGGPVPDGPFWEITERFVVKRGFGVKDYNYKLRKVSIKEARGKWLVLYFHNNLSVFGVGDEKRLVGSKTYSKQLDQVVSYLHKQGVPIEKWDVMTFMTTKEMDGGGGYTTTPADFTAEKFGIDLPWNRGIHGAAQPGSDKRFITDIARWHLKNLLVPYIDHYTDEFPLEDNDREYRLKMLLDFYRATDYAHSQTHPSMPFAILDPKGRLRFIPDWAYCRDISGARPNQSRWDHPVRARCADLKRVNADMSNLGIVTNVLFTLTGQTLPDDMKAAFGTHPLADVEFPDQKWGGVPRYMRSDCGVVLDPESGGTIRGSYPEPLTPTKCRKVLAQFREWFNNPSTLVERHEMQRFGHLVREAKSGEPVEFHPEIGVMPSASRAPLEVRMVEKWGDFQKELLGQLTH